MVGKESSFSEQSYIWQKKKKKKFPTLFSTWHIDRIWHAMKIQYNLVGKCFLVMLMRKGFIFILLQILVHRFIALRIRRISKNNGFNSWFQAHKVSKQQMPTQITPLFVVAFCLWKLGFFFNSLTLQVQVLKTNFQLKISKNEIS